MQSVKFRMIRGRIVPIALASGVGAAALGYGLGKTDAPTKVRPQRMPSPRKPKQFRPAASPMKRQQSSQGGNLSGRLIRTGVGVAGLGGLLSAYGQDKLMRLKIIKPVKNPFRGMRVAEKATVLKKVKFAKEAMEWGKAGKLVGLTALGLGVIGASYSAAWGKNAKR